MPTVIVEAAFGVLPGTVPDQHLNLDGTSSTFASTPDAAALDITSDIDLRAVLAPPDWGASAAVLGKASSGQFSYSLELVGSRIRLALSADGTLDVRLADSSVVVPFAPDQRAGIRATWRASDSRVQFFTSTDDGATWTQLGSDQNIGSIASIHSGTAVLQVGRIFTTPALVGRVSRAEVRSGLGGTVVASPDFTSTGDGWQVGDDSGTSARNDAQGRPWSLQGNAGIVSEWTNLTSRVGYPGGISWSYGRQNERESADAGHGTITFDNADRALDPTNQASPYWPFVRPMTRIRVRATHLSVTYPVLEAFVESWPPRWKGDHHAYVTCDLVDGFKLLAQARTSVSFPLAASGTRVGALLDRAGWPAGRRMINAGQSEVQAYTASDRIVLNAIRDTAETESGMFFIDPSGNAVFRDRLSRIVAESQATFDELSATLPYEDLRPSYDDALLWNDIAVKPEGLTVQRAVDETSQKTYGHRHLPEFGALVTTTLEASDLAHWTLRRYKKPRLRIDAIDLAGDLFPAVMTQILAREVGHRVTVQGRSPGGGAVISEEVFIEHVKHDIGATSWRATWRLSPAFAETVWLAGVVGFSEAGVSTFAGF